MIVRKSWNKKGKYGEILIHYEGLFLFGIIPLYIKVEK